MTIDGINSGDPGSDEYQREIVETVGMILGRRLDISPESVTRVGQISDVQRSLYAEVFAQNYNALDGIETREDFLQLFRGNDKRVTGPFILNHLRQHGCRSVLDACGGCEYDSIFLRGAAARGELSLDRLVSNEVDVNLRREGVKNLALAQSAAPFDSPGMTAIPWQEFSGAFDEQSFDATLCTGNSISHLSDADQRRLCLANFARITNNVCIVDTRNYHRMLHNAPDLLAQAGEMLDARHFEGSTQALFPGRVTNFPVSISEDRIVMAYVIHGQEQPYALVEFYPLQIQALLQDLKTVFGHVDLFADGQPISTHNLAALNAIDGPGTIQCVCTEPKHDMAARMIGD